MDFKSCQILASKANENTLVSVLARANFKDIDRALEAIKDAKKAYKVEMLVTPPAPSIQPAD